MNRFIILVLTSLIVQLLFNNYNRSHPKKVQLLNPQGLVTKDSVGIVMGTYENKSCVIWNIPELNKQATKIEFLQIEVTDSLKELK